MILAQTTIIDLAAGDRDAASIAINNKEVPTGFYNALSWKMEATEDGLLPDQTIVLQGKAVKAQRNVNFWIGFSLSCAYFY